MKTKNYLLFLMIILFTFVGHSQGELGKSFKATVGDTEELNDCAINGSKSFDFNVSGVDSRAKFYEIFIVLNNLDDILLTELDVIVQSPSGTRLEVLSPSVGKWDNLPHNGNIILRIRDCPDYPLGSANLLNGNYLTRPNESFSAFDNEDITGTWKIEICAKNNAVIQLELMTIRFDSPKPYGYRFSITDATSCFSNDGSFNFRVRAGRCNSPSKGLYKLNTETDWNTYIINVGGATYTDLLPGTYELTVAMAPDGVNIDENTKYTQQIVVGARSGTMVTTCQADLNIPRGETVIITPPNYCGPELKSQELFIRKPNGNEVGPIIYDGKTPLTYTYKELGVYLLLWKLNTENDFDRCVQKIEVKVKNTQEKLWNGFTYPLSQPKDLKNCVQNGYDIFEFPVSGIGPAVDVSDAFIILQNNNANNELLNLDLYIESPSGTKVQMMSPFKGKWDNLPQGGEGIRLLFKDCPDFPLGSANKVGSDFWIRPMESYDAFAGEDRTGIWKIGMCSTNPDIKLHFLRLAFDSKKPYISNISIVDATSCTAKDGAFSCRIKSGICYNTEKKLYKLDNETDWNTYTGAVNYTNLESGTYKLSVGISLDGVNVDQSLIRTHQIVIAGSAGSLIIDCQSDLKLTKNETILLVSPKYCGPVIKNISYQVKDPQGNIIGPYNYNGQPVTYTFRQSGIYGINWIITTANDLGECTQLIEIANPDPCKNDVTAPVLKDCPQDQAIILDDNDEGVFAVKDPIVSDNCRVTSMQLKITMTGGGTFRNGATELIFDVIEGKDYSYFVKGSGVVNFNYEIKDAAGNVSVCTSKVQVLTKNGPCRNDVTAPKVSICPADEILILDDGKVFSPIEIPSFSDNCAVTDIKAIFTYFDGATHPSGDIKVVQTGLSAGLKGKIGIIGSGRATIEYIAVDPSGNEGNCIVEYRAVQPGSNVLFNIVSQCAVPGQNTSLPVTVSRFKSIGAFSFDLQVPTGSGLSFIGLENTALNNVSFNVIANGDLRISWDDPNGSDISLEDNFRIFDVVIRASANFKEASTITGKDLAILSSVNDKGSVGFANICVGTAVKPSGKILNPAGIVHKDVDIRLLAGTKTINTTSSDVNGKYSFDKTDDTYRIEAYKNDQIRLGVSIVDVAKIRRHFLQTTVLKNNYDVVAADVNRDGKINVLDVAYTNRVLLQKRNNFPNNTSWRFLPSALDISNNPIDPNLQSAIKLDASNLDYENLDFVSIKVGDVDHSALDKLQPDIVNIRSAGQLILPDTTVLSNDMIQIPVYIKGDEMISLFSMTMKYDTNLFKFTGIKSDKITSFSGGNYNDLGGDVLIAWDHPQGGEYNSNGVLMTLMFEGRSESGTSEINMEDVLFYDKDFTKIEFNVTGGSIELTPTAVNNLSDIISITASPNPFRDRLNIGVLTSTAQEVNLTLRDLSGNVIKEMFSTQRNTVHHFNIDDVDYHGVILVSIKGKDFIKTLRVIRL